MLPPTRYTKAKSGEVCRLKRSLYGLKQASRQWNKELGTFLKTLKFQQSTQDFSIYTRTQDEELLVILLYVDDIMVIGTSLSQIEEIKLALDIAFTIKDLGQLTYFLGIEVHRRNGIFLSQKNYIKDILTDAGMGECFAAPAHLSVA